VRTSKTVAVILGIAFCTALSLCVIAYLPIVGQLKLISTSWVVEDPSFKKNSEFEYGGWRLGQPARGYVLDGRQHTMHAAAHVPECISYCELDAQEDITVLVGHDRSDHGKTTYEVLVRRPDGLAKVYEYGAISVCSVSPDGKRIAVVAGTDVIVKDIHTGTTFACNISSPADVVPCWYSDDEILISTVGSKIIRYDVRTRRQECVLRGTSPVLWKGGIMFQRFERHRESNCLVFFVSEIGGSEELLFENRYICGPLNISPDGNYLCCQATYAFTERDWIYILVPGNSLYVRNLNDESYTYYTDADHYERYWTWKATEDL